MIIGDPMARDREELTRFRQLTYTCLHDVGTRYPETLAFPEDTCAHGIIGQLPLPDVSGPLGVRTRYGQNRRAPC